MRILFAGTPAAAVPALQKLFSSNHDVVAVLTAPAAPAGRGRKETASAVSLAAQELGIPVLAFENVNSEAAHAALRELNLDAVAVVAYGQLLKPETLNLIPAGWVNLHFSLLPAYRGAAPVQRAILAGEEFTGASTFWIEAGMDTGPVFGQLTVEINNDETSGDLLERLANAGADLLVATMDGIADGSLRPTPQPNSDVSYAPKVQVAEAEIDWSHPALSITRKIRAFNPAPFSWTTFAGQKLLVAKAHLVESRVDLAPAEIEVTKSSILVGTGSCAIELIDVKPAGKGWMAGADWARGIRTSNWKFDSHE